MVSVRATFLSPKELLELNCPRKVLGFRTPEGLLMLTERVDEVAYARMRAKLGQDEPPRANYVLGDFNAAVETLQLTKFSTTPRELALRAEAMAQFKAIHEEARGLGIELPPVEIAELSATSEVITSPQG